MLERLGRTETTALFPGLLVSLLLSMFQSWRAVALRIPFGTSADAAASLECKEQLKRKQTIFGYLKGSVLPENSHHALHHFLMAFGHNSWSVETHQNKIILSSFVTNLSYWEISFLFRSWQRFIIFKCTPLAHVSFMSLSQLPCTKHVVPFISKSYHPYSAAKVSAFCAPHFIATLHFKTLHFTAREQFPSLVPSVHVVNFTDGSIKKKCV